MSERVRQVLRVLQSAVLTLGAGLGVVVLVGVAAGVVFGIRPVVITSGSMEPAIGTGDLALTRPVPAGDIEVGDVVTVPTSTGARVTHRVVSTEPRDGVVLLRLQGDANESPDAEDHLVARVDRVVAQVPAVGYVLSAARSPLGIFAMGVGAALLIAFVIRGGRPPRDGAPPPSRGRRGRRAPRGTRRAAVSVTAGAALLVAGVAPSTAAFTDDVPISGTDLATHTVVSQAAPVCSNEGGILGLLGYSRLTWTHVDTRYEYAYTITRVGTGTTVSGVVTPAGAAGAPVTLDVTSALLSLTVGSVNYDVAIRARLTDATSWTAATTTVTRVHSVNLLVGLSVRCGSV